MEGDFLQEDSRWTFTKNDKQRSVSPIYINLPNQLKNCLP